MQHNPWKDEAITLADIQQELADAGRGSSANVVYLRLKELGIVALRKFGSTCLYPADTAQRILARPYQQAGRKPSVLAWAIARDVNAANNGSLADKALVFDRVLAVGVELGLKPVFVTPAAKDSERKGIDVPSYTRGDAHAICVKLGRPELYV